MRYPTALLVLLAAIAVIGCSNGGAANPSPSPAAASLDGRTFLSSQVTGHDLAPGSSVRLTFGDGRIGINAGCNSMSGAYAVVDGQLATDQLATTDMACDPALMQQDTWVAAFIDGAALTLAGNTLTLKHGDVTMTLDDRVVADPDRPLDGTRWVLDGIVSGDAVSSVPVGVTAAITISNDTMRVEGGCNTGSATVEVTDTTLTIGPLAMTRKACAPDAMTVEAAMIGVLSGQVDYAIEADVLTITGDDAGLTFRAAS